MFDMTSPQIDTDVTNYSTASDLDSSREINDVPTFTLAVAKQQEALLATPPSGSAGAVASAANSQLMQEAAASKREEEGE